MTPNEGSRPKGLQDSDKVRVVLHNGTERVWTVATRQGPVNWRSVPASDPWHPYSIKEWERA